MSENRIHGGEPFRIYSGEKKKSVLSIQNFIGAHTSPFVLDFDRNMKKLDLQESEVNIGVINSHDYDLHPAYTLKCIEHLLKDSGAEFFSYDDLKRQAELKAVKEISLK